MTKIKIYKLILEVVEMKFYIAIVTMVMFAISLKSQTFTMTGASSTFVNNGKFTFVTDGGQFQTDTDSDGNIANSGTITFAGARPDGIYFSNTTGTADAGSAGYTDPVRLSGWIYFSNTIGSGTQTVQSRYYTSLGVSGGATKAYVSNGALVPTYVSGTYNVVSGSGSRNYDGNSTTFIYDGATAQNVFAENMAGTSGRYYNLYFRGAGTKSVLNGTLVQVQNEVRSEASNSGGVTVNGNMWAENNFVVESGAGQFLVDGATGAASLTFGSGTATIDGDLFFDESGGVGVGEATAYTDGGGVVNVNSTGSLNMTSGTFYVADGPLNLNASGSMTLAPTGYLDVANSQTFYVAGDLNNQIAANGTNARNNTIYADDSWAIFENVNLHESDEQYPYGNLEARGSSGTISIGDGASDKVFLSNNLLVTGNNLNLLPYSSTLTMLDQTATPTYGTSTITEVVGRMARRTNGTSNTLTFNNAQMLVNISAGSGSVSEITLDSRPGNQNSAYDAARDVQRTVDLYYQATDNFVAQMRYSYLSDEAPSSTINEQDLRFREDLGGGTTEKVSTGNALTRDASASPGLRWVQLDGIRRTGDGTGLTDLAEVNNPGSLFLRGGPTTYISIASGRWSNPNTWDEGEQPGYRDEAVVRHTVHIGYQRTIDNFGTSEDTKLNTQRAGMGMDDGIASRILIDDAYGDLSATPSEKATLLTGNNTTVALYNDTDPGAVARSGYLDINPRHGTESTNFTDGTNVGTTVSSGNSEYNKGFVIFAGSTFIIYNGSMNNNTLQVDTNANFNVTAP